MSYNKPGPVPVIEGELTKRELQVAQLILEGHAYKEIAFRIGTTHKTVTAHVTNINRKLRTNSSRYAVRILAEKGLISFDRVAEQRTLDVKRMRDMCKRMQSIITAMLLILENEVVLDRVNDIVEALQDKGEVV